MLKNVLNKFMNKKGEGEGKTSYDLIGLILVIIVIAMVSIPITNTIRAGGRNTNDNYKKVYNNIIKAANDNANVSVELEGLSEVTSTEVQ